MLPFHPFFFSPFFFLSPLSLSFPMSQLLHWNPNFESGGWIIRDGLFFSLFSLFPPPLLPLPTPLVRFLPENPRGKHEGRFLFFFLLFFFFSSFPPFSPSFQKQIAIYLNFGDNLSFFFPPLSFLFFSPLSLLLHDRVHQKRNDGRDKEEKVSQHPLPPFFFLFSSPFITCKKGIQLEERSKRRRERGKGNFCKPLLPSLPTSSFSRGHK